MALEPVFTSATRTRTEWAYRVQRARIRLAYCTNSSTYAVGEAISVIYQIAQRCLDRAVRLGVVAALDDSLGLRRDR